MLFLLTLRRLHPETDSDEGSERNRGHRLQAGDYAAPAEDARLRTREQEDSMEQKPRGAMLSRRGFLKAAAATGAAGFAGAS